MSDRNCYGSPVVLFHYGRRLLCSLQSLNLVSPGLYGVCHCSILNWFVAWRIECFSNVPENFRLCVVDAEYWWGSGRLA